jgi:hypothetical protein
MQLLASALLLLPACLAAPAPGAGLLTKHVKAPSPFYSPPVYNEHTGQGLTYGHGAQAAYLAPVKPGHVFTGYPSGQHSHGGHSSQHAGHYQSGHYGHQQAVYSGHQQAVYPGHQQAVYPGHQQQAAYPGHHQLAYPATAYLDHRYPGLGLKAAN